MLWENERFFLKISFTQERHIHDLNCLKKKDPYRESFPQVARSRPSGEKEQSVTPASFYACYKYRLLLPCNNNQYAIENLHSLRI